MDDARSRFVGRLRAGRGRPRRRRRPAARAARPRRRSPHRRERQGRAARPRQHPPPPAAGADAQRPARPGGAALPLAGRALRGLAPPRRGRGHGRRARRPRRAAADGLHHHHRPPLPLPEGPGALHRRRDRRGARARDPLPPDARLDEPRQEPGRPAAGRRVPGRGDDPRRLAPADPRVPRPARRARCCASHSRRARRSR